MSNTPPLSRRMNAVQAPVIPDVAALIRDNPGTISLGQGVVHYGPPAEAFAAIDGFGSTPAEHHYRNADGIPELQQALRSKLADDNSIHLDDARQVLFVTAGSNMAFYHVVLSVCDPGDEVIVMSPFYFNHEMAIAMANAQAVVVPSDECYGLRVTAIEAAITERTRMVVTISPNNPAGVVYTPESLRLVNELCRERGIYHVSDEAYEYFTYDGARHLSPGSLPDSIEHTISLFSFSKTYGLANWRVGYMVAPRALLRALQKSQDTVLICPPVISQLAAVGALQAGPDYCRTYVAGIDGVRTMCLQRLQELAPDCIVPEANGAFYLLARLDTPMPSLAVVERLVRNHKVAVIPGIGFGLTDVCHIRIAYGALQAHSVEEGMDRLVNGLSEILHTA
jgi:aspartate/methionine/tyrosine aminotransferase